MMTAYRLSKGVVVMSYERLTEYAGWFLSTPGNWYHHLLGDHFIDDENWTYETPHYTLHGAFVGFSEEFSFMRTGLSLDDCRRLLDERGLVLEDDVEKLAAIDVSAMDDRGILAIIKICIDDDPSCTGLLYHAAESSLLDRCLFKLRDIDRMTYPNWNHIPENRVVVSKKGSWYEYDEEHLPEWVWCLVGNVIDERIVGKDKRVIHGTRHFSPGTKVYCFPAQWGDGYEKIAVLGKHRGSKGLIRIVMSRKLVKNFRCQKVYSPNVIRRMYGTPDGRKSFVPWGNSDDDHARIMGMCQWLNTPEEEERRRSLFASASEITISTHMEDMDEGDTTLRIVRMGRRDGCYGAAWNGFYRAGVSEEVALGTIDWYGYWPDNVPYEVCAGSYRSEAKLLNGLLDAQVHHWDNTDDRVECGSIRYSWSLQVTSDNEVFACEGHGRRPYSMPSVFRYFEAWGFPKIWNSNHDAPDAKLCNET